MDGDDRAPSLLAFWKRRGFSDFDQLFSQFGESATSATASSGKAGAFQESIRPRQKSAMFR